MPSFDIIKRSEPARTFRVASIVDTYDLQNNKVTEHFSGSFELPEEWNVGLIVGRSGTGKTTIARHLFGDNVISQYEYTHECFMDDMPKDCSVKEICEALCSVGFASPPSWLKSYDVLSNGEKMRCDLARAMLEKRELFCFDEFTSVVDRNVAHIGSLAMQKAIRRKNRKFVAVTCHYDVQEWLMPDWVFNTDTMQFQVLDFETQKKNKPTINIDIFQLKSTEEKKRCWNIFRKYHYLSDSFNMVADAYICTANGEIAGFTSLLHFPHFKYKNIKRVHRTVVLPDYQGVGIGTSLNDCIAQRYKNNGFIVRNVTSSPQMIASLLRNKKWECAHKGRIRKTKGNYNSIKNSASSNRITCSFAYIGGFNDG